MGFNIRGGDKSSLALLSSKRGRAYARTKADEAFALPNFSDAIPAPTIELQHQSNNTAGPEQPVEHDAENVKQTMLQHESVFKEQLHELHRLYQKQCMLMAESNKDPGCDPMPKPPSPDSSFLCNSETLRVQDDRSFGNASSVKVFENNQSYHALLSRMDDVKRYEGSGSSGKPSNHQMTEVSASSQNQGRHEMIDLEKPPPNHPTIDLERPADEYMDVEVQEEKPQIAGLINKSENVFASGYSHSSAITKPGEKIELVSGVHRGLGHNRLWGYQIINDRVSDYPAGREEERITGCLQYKESAVNHPSLNEVLPFPGGLVTAPTCLMEQPLLYPKKTPSTSGLSGCLPDLNGDVQLAEEQLPPIQALLQKNEGDGQGVDFEADSRSCSSTSKLPHWLRQAPSIKASPSHASWPSSVPQQKTSVFSPQAHDMTTKSSVFLPQVHDKTIWRSNLPVETQNASSLYIQEPNYPCPQASTISFKQGEAFHRELPSASLAQFFRVATAEGPYSGVYGRDCLGEDAPFYFPQTRDGEKMGILPVKSASLFPHVMGNRGLECETHGPPVEPFSRVRSEGLNNLSTMSPWYQQRESFSSLLQQASNPEPFGNRLSPVVSVSPWEITSNYQGPLPGMDHSERSVFGLHTDVRKAEGSLSQPKSTTASPGFGHMHAGSVLDWTINITKESTITSCREIETSFCKGHLPESSSSGDHHVDMNPRKILFDLNLSSEDCVLEENFDRCNIVDSSCNENQPQCLKQESEMSRSSGWDTSSAMKAPLMYESQNLQVTCFRESLAAKGATSEVPAVSNVAHSQNELSHVSKAADILYSEGDMRRNDPCADYCSGEDETGGGFVGVKSSDGSGLTSCDSRGRVHLEPTKGRDDSNTSSGEACHSLESRIPSHKEDVSFERMRSLGLLTQMNCVSKSFMFPDMQITPPHIDTKREGSPYNCTEFADESEAANVVAKKDMVEASEAAELLLSFASDLSSTVENDAATDYCRKCLDWLADNIPPEDYCQPEDMDVEIGHVGKHEDRKGNGLALEVTTEETLDAFELAVLALEPVDPNSECLAIQPLDRGNFVENIPTLRRRPSRRGRAGKDFQKEMLRSMSALSRHDITEDLQIIEGLIKSAAETTNSCSPVLDDKPLDKPLSSPEQFSSKSFGKVKSTKACRGSKLNGVLNVCSWGGSTRRKRMGRQRSQWLSLPAGVQISLFPNNAANVAS